MVYDASTETTDKGIETRGLAFGLTANRGVAHPMAWSQAPWDREAA